jgi:hypothetical protein
MLASSKSLNKMVKHLLINDANVNHSNEIPNIVLLLCFTNKMDNDTSEYYNA